MLLESTRFFLKVQDPSGNTIGLLKVQDASWKYMVLLESTGCFLKVQSVSWRFKLLLESTRCCLEEQDASWKYKLLLENRRRLLEVQDASWKYTMLLDITRCFAVYNLHGSHNKKTGAKKNGGRWRVRIIGACFSKKTGADPGPQSSIAWPVAFFSMDDPDFVISYFLIECLSNPVRIP